MAKREKHPVSEEEAIHLPGPTLGPPILGLGTGLILAGMAVGGPLLILPGVAVSAAGLGIWLRDTAREAAEHE